MQTFMIDREIWLRGEGGGKSYLLRETDQKQCCVGIYLEQVCGVSRGNLEGVRSAEGLDLDECGGWLVATEDDQHITGSSVADELYAANDNQFGDPTRLGIGQEPYTPEEREAKIAEFFASEDVEVTFIN